MHPKSYPDLLQKVILQLEIGYKNKPERLSYNKTKISKYLDILKDETQLKAGSEVIWLWVATIESETKNILAISLSKERNMLVAVLCCMILSFQIHLANIYQ